MVGYNADKTNFLHEEDPRIASYIEPRHQNNIVHMV